MPIEFACESCKKLLRVPDGSGGSSCECPSCNTLLEIPDPLAIEIIDGVDDAGETDQLTVPCPKCNYDLVCSPNLLGTKGQCRNCKYIFLISPDSDDVGTAAEAQSTGLVFTCPKCDQLFEGREEMQGRKGKCHACGDVFEIQLSEVEPPTKPTPSREAPRKANPTSAAPIQLACSSCEGVMEVPASAAGQTTACPYCQQLLHIPVTGDRQQKPSTAEPSQRSDAPVSTPQADQQDAWTDLGNFGGSAGDSAQDANPYQAPSAAWQAPKSTRSRRGLTFSNAFSLTFEVAFPTCLVAALIYVIFAIANAAITYGSMFLLGLYLRNAGLDETTRFTLAGIALFLLAIIGICISTTGFCMICNGALAAVRKKKIDSAVLFSTGDVFVPMLVFLFITTLAYAALLWIPRGILMLGSGFAPVAVLFSLLSVVAILFASVSLSLTPFAIMDGENPIDAMGSSFRVFMSNAGTMLGTIICGVLLYLLIGMVTCGIGAFLLVGLPVYLLAAIYHLGTR